MGSWVDATQVQRAGPPLRYKAWVPAPIAEIDLPDTPAQLADCEQHTAEMRRLAATPDSSIDWLLVAAEAAASSAIEDIFVSPRALLRAMFAGSGTRTRTASQVVADVAATRRALEIGSGASPVSVDDILSIHAALTTDLAGYTYAPGAVRRHQVVVGGFVPPPHDRLTPLLEDLAAFCNRTDIEPLAHGAIAHARFEEIHPFPDGNGRTGRALVHTLWAKRGLISGQSIVPFSVGLARWRMGYYAALGEFQSETSLTTSPGATTPILDAFIAAVAIGLERTAALRERLQGVEPSWQRASDAAGEAPAVVDAFIDSFSDCIRFNYGV